MKKLVKINLPNFFLNLICLSVKSSFLCKSNNFFDNGIKFVILDEVDYMTKNAQQALKYLLQCCGNNVKFCLICNYISKVDDSLQNEFICVRFNQLPRDEIYKFIDNYNDIIDNDNDVPSIGTLVNRKQGKRKHKGSQATVPLEVVGMDIGYGADLSIGGFKYVLVLVDQCTRHLFIYRMHKS